MTALWPLVPNWASGLKETYEFKTEIITSRSGKEQRRALRTTPRRTVEYDSLVNGAALQRMEGLLARSQGDLMWGADFVRGVKTTAALPLSGNSLTVRSVPAWLVVGAKVSLSYRRDSRLFTVQAISGLTITFVESSPVSFGAGARLSRVVAGYVDSSLPTTRVTGTVATVATTFEPDPATEPVDEGEIDVDLWFQLGREILMDRPNWTRAPTITFSQDVETVDYGQGRVARFKPIRFGTRVHQATYLNRSRDEADRLRQFFARMKGRRGEFYFPTWQNDLPPMQNVSEGDFTLTVAGRDTFDAYADDLVHRAILISMKGGHYFARQVESLALVGSNTVLLLEQPWLFDVEVSDVEAISWMPVCRFASDKLTLDWVTDGVSQVTISVQTLEAQPSEMGIELDELTRYMLSTYGWIFTRDVFVDPLDYAVNWRWPQITRLGGNPLSAPLDSALEQYSEIGPAA